VKANIVNIEIKKITLFAEITYFLCDDCTKEILSKVDEFYDRAYNKIMDNGK